MRKGCSNQRRSSEVVAGSGEHRVDMVAVAPQEMVATHPMMADHGFDVGMTTHLAANGLGNMPDLAADPDLEELTGVAARPSMATRAISGHNYPDRIGDLFRAMG